MFDFTGWPERKKLETFEFDLSTGSCGDIKLGGHIDALKPWGRPIFSAIGCSLDYRESGIMVKLVDLNEHYIASFLCYLRPVVFAPKPDFNVCPLQLKVPEKSKPVQIKPGSGKPALHALLGVAPVIGGNPAHGMCLGFKFPGAWVNFDYGDKNDFNFLTITRDIGFYVNRSQWPGLEKK